VTSSQVTLQGLLMNELSLFRHLSVKLEEVILLLTWWKTHEGRKHTTLDQNGQFKVHMDSPNLKPQYALSCA
jgi:hypothetical protein